MKKNILISIVGVLVLALILSACGKDSAKNASVAGDETKVNILNVGATPEPHAQILKIVQPLLKEEGIDLQKNAIKFDTYELTTAGGIRFNEKGETSMRGLYAAGDEYFGGISAAAVFGWLAGENASEYAKHTQETGTAGHEAELTERQDRLRNMQGRENGISWQEANMALQQVMQDFAPGVRSETLLEAGLEHLRRIKEKAQNHLIANNPHDLMRSLEVLNLFDIGELVFLSARERKETRGPFIRTDHSYANPMLSGKSLICKQVNGKPVVEWK